MMMIMMMMMMMMMIDITMIYDVVKALIHIYFDLLISMMYYCSLYDTSKDL